MTIDPEQLDELLAKEPYLDDGGFTARVMAELPPPRDRRAIILGLSGVAAAATAAWVLPGVVRLGLAAATTAALPAALPPALVVGAAAALVAGVVAGLVLTVQRS